MASGPFTSSLVNQNNNSSTPTTNQGSGLTGLVGNLFNQAGQGIKSTFSLPSAQASTQPSSSTYGAPLAMGLQGSTSPTSSSQSNGIPTGGLPLASGVTPITTVAQAQAAGAKANSNNALVGANSGALGAALNSNTGGTQGVYNPAPVLSPYASATQNVGNVSAQGANNIVNTGNQGANSINNAAFNNQTYGPTTTNAINNLGTTATTAQNIGTQYGNEITAINTGAQNQATGDLTSGGTQPVSTGAAGLAYSNASGRIAGLSAAEQAALAGNSQAQTAYNSQGNLGFTGQGQQIGAAGTAANQALTGATSGANTALTGATTVASNTAPQQYGLYNQPYNPMTDTYGGGASGGAINRSVNANNISLAGQYNTTINNTQQAQNAADDAFSIAGQLANGVAGDTPIFNAVSQLYANTAGGSSTVSALQNSLQQILTQYQNITGSVPPYTVNNITPSQLQSLKTSLDTNATNTIGTTRKQLDDLNTGGATGGNSTQNTSNFGGSSWQ